MRTYAFKLYRSKRNKHLNDKINILALALVVRYAFIFVENLNMKAMQRMWGRKISDLGHAQFLNTLAWQMHKNGSQGAKIDRFYPSSKTCS
jgi:putative transposase